MDFTNIVGFDWDEENFYKNIEKHNVFDTEAEQIFFNHPLIVKERFYALGRTNHGRLLFIAFTVRSEKIRVISARDMAKKEVRVYEDYKKRSS